MAYKMFSRQGSTPPVERTVTISSFKYTAKVLDTVFNGTTAERIEAIKNATGGVTNTWHFPLPNTINDNNSVAWEGTGLTSIAEKGVTKGADAVSSSSELGKTATKSASLITKLIKKGGQAEGKVMNPNSYISFKGSAPRDIVLTFSFTPNDLDEAKEIQRGLIAVKRDMSPNRDSVIVLGAPHVFSLQFGSKNSFLNTMISFELCVLKDLKINFGTDGNLAMFVGSDGQLYPKQTTVTMTFSEFTPKTVKEWYKKLQSIK